MAWYGLSALLFLSALACGRKCSLHDFPGYIGSVLVSCLVFGAFYFFVDLPGKKLIQTRLYVRQLRRKLDPLAVTVGAKADVRHDEQGAVLCYTFPDGNYVSLTVWGNGSNTWSPNWDPGHEKHTEGFELLLRGIENERRVREGY
jgi:hypothetical protein